MLTCQFSLAKDVGLWRSGDSVSLAHQMHKKFAKAFANTGDINSCPMTCDEEDKCSHSIREAIAAVKKKKRGSFPFLFINNVEGGTTELT